MSDENLKPSGSKEKNESDDTPDQDECDQGVCYIKEAEEKDDSKTFITDIIDKATNIEESAPSRVNFDENLLSKLGLVESKDLENIDTDEDASKLKAYIPKGYIDSAIMVLDPDIIPEKQESTSVEDESISLSMLSSIVPSEILEKMSEIFAEEKQDTALKYGPLIGAIDEGTSSTRFLVSTYWSYYFPP